MQHFGELSFLGAVDYNYSTVHGTEIPELDPENTLSHVDIQRYIVLKSSIPIILLELET